MNKKILSLSITGALIILGFLFYFISIGNYEFIGYALFVGILLSLILYSDKYINYPSFVLWIFVFWIFLHFGGGAFYIDGIKLYDLILIDLIGSPYDILKYDQLIHAYCYFSISMLAYCVAKNKFKKIDLTVKILIIMIALGISGINEIIEFGMVIWADAAEAVGGYYNTLMDMVMNLLGSIIGVALISKYKK